MFRFQAMAGRTRAQRLVCRFLYIYFFLTWWSDVFLLIMCHPFMLLVYYIRKLMLKKDNCLYFYDTIKQPINSVASTSHIMSWLRIVVPMLRLFVRWVYGIFKDSYVKLAPFLFQMLAATNASSNDRKRVSWVNFTPKIRLSALKNNS